MLKQKMLALALLSAASLNQAHAAEDQDPKGMTGRAEFGMVLTSGNSDSSTMNGKFSLTNDTEQWLHVASLDLLRAESESVKTAEHYVLNAKSNYKLQDDQFLFVGLNHDVDKFSGFDYQTSITAGYGRKLYDTEQYKLSLEIGPGYRISKLKAGGDNNEAILHLGAISKYIINPASYLDGTLVIDTGSSQTITVLALGYVNSLSSSLALKVGYNLKHSSDVPAGTNKSDSITSISLIYSF
jgi:putative salt-induced outer membrane protein